MCFGLKDRKRLKTNHCVIVLLDDTQLVHELHVSTFVIIIFGLQSQEIQRARTTCAPGEFCEDLSGPATTLHSLMRASESESEVRILSSAR